MKSLINTHAAVLILLILSSTPGCAYRQLQHSTARQAKTITDLQYQQVLNNLAMFSQNPNALPSVLDFKNGSTQVSDIGNLTASLTWGGGGQHGAIFGGSRAIVDQWGSAPITDDNALSVLQYAYQRAFGYAVGLQEEEANDMAFDFATQLPTTADISTDGDMYRHLLSLLKPESFVSNQLAGKLERRSKTIGNKIETLRKSPVISGAGIPMVDLASADVTKEQIDDLTVLLRDAPWFTATDSETLRSYANDLLKQIDLFLADLSRVIDNKQLPFRLGLTRRTGPFGTVLGDNIETKTNTLEDWLLKKSVLARANAYKELSSEITTTLHDKMLALKPDGTFAPANLPATGLVKAVNHKVNEIQKTLVEIPSGWFKVGRIKDVPLNACYVGKYCSCGHEIYAWVCDDGKKGLADFTLKVLKLSSEFKQAQVYNVPSGIQFSPALAGQSK
jgi:hypothetical protein